MSDITSRVKAIIVDKLGVDETADETVINFFHRTFHRTYHVHIRSGQSLSLIHI